MQAELALFYALKAANVPDDKAQAAAEAVTKDIDARYSLHSQQLATRGDLEQLRGDVRTDMAAMESRLVRAIAESQRWTILAMFGGLGALAMIQKYL